MEDRCSLDNGGDDSANLSLEVVILLEGGRKRGKQRSKCLQFIETGQMIGFVLLKPDDGGYGMPLAEVTSPFSAPGRSVNKRGWFHFFIQFDPDHRTVVIQKAASGNVFQPECCMGTFSGTGFSQKKDGLVVVHDDRCVQSRCLFWYACKGHCHPERKL